MGPDGNSAVIDLAAKDLGSRRYGVRIVGMRHPLLGRGRCTCGRGRRWHFWWFQLLTRRRVAALLAVARAKVVAGAAQPNS